MTGFAEGDPGSRRQPRRAVCTIKGSCYPPRRTGCWAPRRAVQGQELGWAVSSGSLSLWWPHAEVATLTGPDGQEGFPHLGCFKGHVLDTVFPLGANSPPVPCRVSPASQPARGVPSLARESLCWLGTNRPRREVDATSLVPRGRLCWRVWVQWFRLETQEPGSLLARKTGTSGHIVLGPGCLISAVFP